MAFESIPTVMNPQQVLDKAFGRASKIEKSDRDRGHRWRKTTLAQFEAVRNILDDTLGRYVTKFPSLDQVSPYHRELILLLIGEDAWRSNLGAVDKGRATAVKMCNRAMQEIRHETDVDAIKAVKRRLYGRVSSVIYNTERPLDRLGSFRAIIRRFPTVSAGLYTVVIAGHPNVGKSSLIRSLTKAEPEVASYPFTTKAANVGHMEADNPKGRGGQRTVKIQLIDTPGLLDRPEDERNEIEHQAALALKHLADLIIFLRDPTGHCGYPNDAQARLLAEVKPMTEGVPLVVIESKADLADQPDQDKGPETAFMRISSATGQGVPELTEWLVAQATKKPDDAELEAYLKGEEMPSHRQRQPDAPLSHDEVEDYDGETVLPSYRARN